MCGFPSFCPLFMHVYVKTINLMYLCSFLSPDQKPTSQNYPNRCQRNRPDNQGPRHSFRILETRVRVYASYRFKTCKYALSGLFIKTLMRKETYKQYMWSAGLSSQIAQISARWMFQVLYCYHNDVLQHIVKTFTFVLDKVLLCVCVRANVELLNIRLILWRWKFKCSLILSI